MSNTRGNKKTSNAGVVKFSGGRPTRLQPADRSGKAVEAKKRVKVIRFTSGSK